MIDDKKIEDLENIAKQIRIDIVKMTTNANSGHPGGSLGSADIFTCLYFAGIMKYDAKQPNWPNRDYFILSNGHICPVWYATLSQAGSIEYDELLTFRKLDSRLQGHPTKSFLPFVEISTGSLGQGIGAAVGLSIGLRIKEMKNRVFCSVGDGELEEGSTWEAAMAASHYNCSNLIVFCDRNGLQQNGNTEDIIGLEPLSEKYRAFGWNVLETDGNNIQKIIEAFEQAKLSKNKPTIIFFKTLMGKGVDFMENDYQWHGKPLPEDLAQKALDILNSEKNLPNPPIPQKNQ